MIHNVALERSDVPTAVSDADSILSPLSHPAADAPPGPIEPPSPIDWEMAVGPAPGRAAAAGRASGAAPGGSSASAQGGGGDQGGRAREATQVHSLGPVGRRRSVILAGLAAVVSLGVYPVFWVRSANREMAQFDPRMTVRPARTAGAVALAVGLPLALALAEAARIVALRLGHPVGLPLSENASRWLLLAPAVAPLLAVLLPFSVVAASMTLERVRIVEDRAGVDPEQQLRPAAAVWWAGLPGIGLAVLVALCQRRLNRIWVRCG